MLIFNILGIFHNFDFTNIKKKNNIRVCPAFLREKVRKICNCPRPHSSFVTEMRTDEFIKRILTLKDNLFRVVFQITGDHNLSEEIV